MEVLRGEILVLYVRLSMSFLVLLVGGFGVFDIVFGFKKGSFDLMTVKSGNFCEDLGCFLFK